MRGSYDKHFGYLLAGLLFKLLLNTMVSKIISPCGSTGSWSCYSNLDRLVETLQKLAWKTNL